MSNYTATIEENYNVHAGSFLSHSISVTQTKRTFSTVEYTFIANHFIQGEIFDDLHFNVYRNANDELIPLFYSELNPVGRTIISENSGERSLFATNSFKLIIEDIGIEENTVNLIFEVTSKNNSKFNYNFNRNISYSTFINFPKMPSGIIEINGASLSNSIIGFFTKEISLKWPAASDIVTVDSSNGYILSYSLDGGSSWTDRILTNLSPVNGYCNYNFNVEGFAPNSSLLFKVCCFNDLKMISEPLFSSVVHKCDVKAAKDIIVESYDINDNLINNSGIVTNETAKLKVSFTAARCVNKLDQILANQTFLYNLDLLNFNVYENSKKVSTIELGNNTSLELIVLDNKNNIDNNAIYILKEDILEALNNKLVNNVNFIIRTIFGSDDENIVLNTESILKLNLFNYDVVPASNLIILNDYTSTAYESSVGQLMPDGEKYIKLAWQKAENVNNADDIFLYDIYIGIDDVFTYENTTTNTFYNFKMEKVNKLTKLNFYIVARNKYVSVKSNISNPQDIHYYNRPYLNAFNVERTKETCNLKFSFVIDSSLPNIGIGFLYVGLDGSSNNVEGLPEATYNNPIQANTEVSARINKLSATSSYVLTINYKDTSNLSETIAEEFRIPSASPIMEVTPSCITMGGADIVNDKTLNIKGDVAIKGKLTVSNYEINSLRDNINSFVESGHYTCDTANAEAIAGLLPLPLSFNLVVIGGFVPIQYLMYTANLGDNHIYMRNFVDNVWSEWILIHQAQ